MKRVLKRLDVTAKSFFALVEPGSCFAGSLLEIALAADRVFMLDADGGRAVTTSPLNAGPLPMGNGLTRLQTRFLREPERVSRALETRGRDRDGRGGEGGARHVRARRHRLGRRDPDRLRRAREPVARRDDRDGGEPSASPARRRWRRRSSARLSAWQNWIFQRPNAVGERGALTLYGKPERPEFDWRRT